MPSLNIDEIKQEYEANVPDCESQLRALLFTKGFTTEELDTIQDEITSIYRDIFDTPEMQYTMDKLNEQLDNFLPAQANSFVADELLSAQMKEAEEVKNAHTVFNAKKSFSLPEPKFTEPKFTSPVDIQDADYTVSEDYPMTYGSIDDTKTWYKINQKIKHAEFVHTSGTQLKIDKDGNVTIYTNGSLKQIINGDFSLEVKGNMDLLVKGNQYEHIGGDKEDLIDGNHTTNISAVRKENASQIHHN